LTTSSVSWNAVIREHYIFSLHLAQEHLTAMPDSAENSANSDSDLTSSEQLIQMPLGAIVAILTNEIDRLQRSVSTTFYQHATQLAQSGNYQSPQQQLMINQFRLFFSELEMNRPRVTDLVVDQILQQLQDAFLRHRLVDRLSDPSRMTIPELSSSTTEVSQRSPPSYTAWLIRSLEEDQ
jgi:hypothetical protein